MRDKALIQNLGHDSGLWIKLRQVVRSWQAKRKLRRLETLDDYMLGDIGLTRDDLYYGQSLPSQVDPIAELVRVREQRIKRGMKTS